MAKNSAEATLHYVGIDSRSVSPAGSGDPIATPTLAEIYLRQGLPQRALQVYRDLLLADPENCGLRRKLEELEKKIREEEALAAEGDLSEYADRAVMEAPAPGSLGERRIEVLGRWLTALRRRRGDVQ